MGCSTRPQSRRSLGLAQDDRRKRLSSTHTFQTTSSLYLPCKQDGALQQDSEAVTFLVLFRIAQPSKIFLQALRIKMRAWKREKARCRGTINSRYCCNSRREPSRQPRARRRRRVSSRQRLGAFLHRTESGDLPLARLNSLFEEFEEEIV